MRKEEAIQQYLDAGFRIIPLNGKIPTEKGWQNARKNPFIDIKAFNKNYGIVLQADDLVIDVDVSEKKDGTKKQGKESFGELVKKTNLDISQTFVVRTGSGGFHIYLKKPKNVTVKERWRAFPDIEFKSKNNDTGKGRQVVGAECIHPDTHKRYKKVLGSPKDVADAPTTLLELIEYVPVSLGDINELKEYKDDEQSIVKATTYLHRTDGAIEGENGDKSTYIVACRCRSFGLSPEVTLDLMLKEWNSKCEPEWEPEDLKTKVYNAYIYDTEPQGCNHPESDFKDVKIEKPEVEVIDVEIEDKPTENDLLWGSDPRKDNTRKGQLQNTVCYLQFVFPKLLQYNLLTKDIEFTRKPRWYVEGQPLSAYDDDDAIHIKHLLMKEQKYEISTMGIHEAVLIDSKRRAYHPIRDYLDKLVWDGKLRVANWLEHYADVDDNAYTRAVGRKTLLAAVARVYDPGCEFHTVLVLEGDQGIGKSRLVKALGKSWYADIHIDPHNKDTVSAMRNNWIIEVSEMTWIKKAEVTALRAFLSRSTDVQRFAYKKFTESVPRSNIFIGTINPDSIGYLSDQAGNRRYWPVKIPFGTDVRVEQMEKDVDQIWAEVVHLYKGGETQLHIDKEIEEMAKAEVEDRKVEDEWALVINDWLNSPDDDGNIRDRVRSIEIWRDCLNGVPRNIKRLDQVRIGDVMHELGWKKTTFREIGNQKVYKGYVRPLILNDVSSLG